jgi:hypothetical protein
MYKTQLVNKIADLLENAIAAYETTDLCLDEEDRGILCELNSTFADVVVMLRQSRRYGRVLLEQYEENLTRKPEYQGDSIDEDEE